MSTRPLIFLAAFLSACSGSFTPKPVTPVQVAAEPLSPMVLEETAFAPSLKQLLVDGTPSGTRQHLLAGVVHHQILRAGKYFQAGHDEAGLAALSGGLLLARSGELRAAMFVGTKATLLAAASAGARAGDEGGAEAYFQLVRAQLSPAERAETDQHLSALYAWQTNTRPPGSMQEAAAAQRCAAKRAVIERTPQTVAAAHRATSLWVNRALQEGRKEAPPTSFFEEDERNEFRRATAMGAPNMVALYLRDGDAAAAASALEAAPLALISNEQLVERLSDASDGDTEAWAEMFGYFSAPSTSSADGIEPAVARAAAWGAALELYRTDPLEISAAVPISTLLVAHGLADAAPLVLQEALGDEPDPRELAWALRLLFQALVAAEQQHDVQLARQVYTNSLEVLATAASPDYQGKVGPSPGEFSYLMGSMETRAGALEAARKHLQRAAEEEPTADVYGSLAAIERQADRPERALEALSQLIALARAQGQLVAEAESQLLVHDIQTERGQGAAATAALAAALKASMALRSQAKNGTQTAAAERVLANALERYGQPEGANRAARRAAEAARNNTRQLSSTLLEASRRALVQSDLSEGRATLRRALEFDLEPQDLLYVALWARLLQERLGAPSDGGVEEAFSRIERDGSWVSLLRDWGRGQLSNAALLSKAKSEVERVEAQFYVAVRDHLTVPTPQTTAALTAVAKSRAIELIEVQIARALLAGPRQPISLPPGVSVP
jgi:hypothetical protein